MQIISLNVLLRYYEETYKNNSKYLQRYPQENVRVDETINFVLNLCKEKAIICLQECSKLLLNNIKNVSSKDYNLFTEIVDDNPEENLITLISKSYGSFKKISPKTELKGIASGILLVSNDNCLIANCHLVPQKHCKKNVNVLKAINDEFECDIPTIIAGDFNAMYQKVVKIFKHKFSVPFFSNTYRRTQLDYILLSKNSSYDFLKKTVVYTDFSDHNLVKVEVCKYT